MREIAELNAKINLLLAMNSLANAEFSRSSEECARLNGMLVQREEELIRRGDELVRLNKELDRQNEQSARLKQQIAGNNAALALKEREILDLSKKSATLNKLADGLKRDNETIRSSTSWRMTAPLRSVVNFFRRQS